MDVEEPELRQRLKRNKSSVGPNDREELPLASSLPPRHPINIVYRLSVMSGSTYGLHKLDVFHQIFRGPKIDHIWFKVGLAASVGE